MSRDKSRGIPLRISFPWDFFASPNFDSICDGTIAVATAVSWRS